MRRLRFALEWLAFAALALLAGSGVYDIAVGAGMSGRYLQWYEARYGALPVSSVVFTCALGAFRGTVTLGCAAAGLAGVVRLRLRYFLLLGVCASWYVGTVVHKAYKGSPAGDWAQLWIAVFCLCVLGAYKLFLWLLLWRKSDSGCAP